MCVRYFFHISFYTLIIAFRFLYRSHFVLPIINGSDKICLGEKSFFDLLSGELWIGERKEKLVGLEFKIFTMLCRNREKTVSRELLIKAGWDKDDYKLHLQLNKYISILRHKISLTSASIVTDKFNGYMLKVTR